METTHDTTAKGGLARKFKSYYVVWKQMSEKVKKAQDTRFKSYYVVWKHSMLSNKRTHNYV